MSNIHHAFPRTINQTVPGEAIIGYLQRAQATETLLKPVEVVEVEAPLVLADNRLEIAMLLDSAGDYKMPRTSAKGMLVEMMSRELHEEGGTYYLGWNIKMNFAWNQTGTLADETGFETQNEFNGKWEDLIENDPSVFEAACARALDPWVSDYVDLLECDGDLMCDISLSKDSDHLLLKSFAGKNLGFETQNDWTRFVFSLDNEDLSKLWTACRVLDEDFSRKERAFIMEKTYNQIRFEKEQDWAYEVEALSF